MYPNLLRENRYSLPPIEEFLSFSDEERQVILYKAKIPPQDVVFENYLVRDFEKSADGGFLKNTSMTGRTRKVGYYPKKEHAVITRLRNTYNLPTPRK